MGRIPVPTHYYKILFDPASRKALSFIIPHQALKTASLGRFRSSIDEIEAITRIDFLSSLEDSVEAEIERSVSAMW